MLYGCLWYNSCNSQFIATLFCFTTQLDLNPESQYKTSVLFSGPVPHFCNLPFSSALALSLTYRINWEGLGFCLLALLLLVNIFQLLSRLSKSVPVSVWPVGYLWPLAKVTPKTDQSYPIIKISILITYPKICLTSARCHVNSNGYLVQLWYHHPVKIFRTGLDRQI